MIKHNREPVFVFVRPQMGENIGAAARGMWNFGLQRMRIVAPRDKWPNTRAVAMASGAGRLLQEATIFNSISEAIADCNFVFSTTVRSRDLPKKVSSPKEAMKIARKRLSSGQKVAFLFGPERSGLENGDISQSNEIVSVQTNPNFSSLNLSQCVLLLSYEWRLSNINAEEFSIIEKNSEIAKAREVQKLADYYENILEEAGFFFPSNKASGMKINLNY